ncbi:venom protein 302-like isoform X2 [Tachypleus tridentatus]
MDRGFLLLIVFLTAVTCVCGLDCLWPCQKEECRVIDESKCKAGTTLDECACCTVCAKAEGEICGGPWDIEGICGTGLFCKKPENQDINTKGICIPISSH